MLTKLSDYLSLGGAFSNERNASTMASTSGIVQDAILHNIPSLLNGHQQTQSNIIADGIDGTCPVAWS